MSFTLYQWPRSNYVESIFPRCVLFQRLMNLSKIDYKIVDVNIPTEGDDFSKKLRTLLLNVPRLTYEEKTFKNSIHILNFLTNEVAGEKTQRNLKDLINPQNFIFEQWANMVFIDSLVYARWKIEKNYQRFIADVSWRTPLSKNQLDQLRKEILRYLEKRGIGHLNEEEFNDLFKSQLWSLSLILDNNSYFGSNQKSLSLLDLSLFMTIQGFIKEPLEQSQLLHEGYENLREWYVRIELDTAKRK